MSDDSLKGHTTDFRAIVRINHVTCLLLYPVHTQEIRGGTAPHPGRDCCLCTLCKGSKHPYRFVQKASGFQGNVLRI
jgi:hypothetical protein